MVKKRGEIISKERARNGTKRGADTQPKETRSLLSEVNSIFSSNHGSLQSNKNRAAIFRWQSHLRNSLPITLGWFFIRLISLASCILQDIAYHVTWPRRYISPSHRWCDTPDEWRRLQKGGLRSNSHLLGLPYKKLMEILNSPSAISDLTYSYHDGNEIFISTDTKTRLQAFVPFTNACQNSFGIQNLDGEVDLLTKKRTHFNGYIRYEYNPKRPTYMNLSWLVRVPISGWKPMATLSTGIVGTAPWRDLPQTTPLMNLALQMTVPLRRTAVRRIWRRDRIALAQVNADPKQRLW